MFPNRAIIALGTNVGNWKNNFNQCLKEINRLGNVSKIANIYLSKPYGLKTQNKFYNTAVELFTNKNPLQLMLTLQQIERCQHKNKKIHNGPRKIDIDIIFFNNLNLQKSNFCIPHPRSHIRDFVLYPVYDIAPFYRHPANKKTIKELIEQLKETYIEKKIMLQKDSIIIH